MTTLRLLLFEDCDRTCSGCCNKDWDLSALPINDNYKGYEMIILTGGEPLLRPRIVENTVKEIRKQTKSPIIVYTAMVKNIKIFKRILKIVDGMTLTLHTQKDGDVFYYLRRDLFLDDIYLKSMRLNIFKDIIVPPVPDYWDIRRNYKWIKNCSLPNNEVFQKLCIKGKTIRDYSIQAECFEYEHSSIKSTIDAMKGVIKIKEF